MIGAWEDLDQAGLISSAAAWLGAAAVEPQRDPIHRFTVDRHLMETAVVAAGLVRRVSRPDLLLLAAILHDIGKGHGEDYPDHSVAGAECRRLAAADGRAARGHRGDLQADPASPAARRYRVARRDPDDPATIAVDRRRGR